MGGLRRTGRGMVPMNLMLPGGYAEYADTGTWSSKAMKEAKLFGEVKCIASSKEDKYTYIPSFDKWQPSTKEASYLHITSNNTIYGTQYRNESCEKLSCPCGRIGARTSADYE